jgi:hypothetical protein
MVTIEFSPPQLCAAAQVQRNHFLLLRDGTADYQQAQNAQQRRNQIPSLFSFHFVPPHPNLTKINDIHYTFISNMSTGK